MEVKRPLKLLLDGLNCFYFINLIKNIFALFLSKLKHFTDSFQTYDLLQTVHLSGPYRKIRTAKGANENASRRPAQLYNKVSYPRFRLPSGYIATKSSNK